jgi:hypothetical protein
LRFQLRIHSPGGRREASTADTPHNLSFRGSAASNRPNAQPLARDRGIYCRNSRGRPETRGTGGRNSRRRTSRFPSREFIRPAAGAGFNRGHRTVCHSEGAPHPIVRMHNLRRASRGRPAAHGTGGYNPRRRISRCSSGEFIRSWRRTARYSDRPSSVVGESLVVDSYSRGAARARHVAESRGPAQGLHSAKAEFVWSLQRIHSPLKPSR